MEFMLTTTDNPYNPFTNYEDWYNYDVAHGHHTCAYIARIANTSDELSDADELLAIEDAIDEIVKLNINGLYIKIDSNYIPRATNIVAS